MASIQEEIIQEFFSELAKVADFGNERITQLRALFNAKTKLKAVDLAKVLSSDPTEGQP